MMAVWRSYWFAPAPVFDLAVVRIIGVALQLYVLSGLLEPIEVRAALPDESWQPLIILNFFHLPFGWGYRPDYAYVEALYYVAIVAGALSLIGLLTNVSLAVFAGSCVYLHAFNYSFNDFHHPEAVMMIALSALALSPAGRALSVDSVIKRWRGGDMDADDVLARSEFAGWPLKLIQWFFVLMYLSAVWSKLTAAGLDWPNGYTLQYALAMDGLRWDSPLALWLSGQHEVVRAGQYLVLLFQGTFVLAALFPRLRWIYVPAGVGLHTFIYITMTAPFFEWIALYSVFIPWARAVEMSRGLRTRLRGAPA